MRAPENSESGVDPESCGYQRAKAHESVDTSEAQVPKSALAPESMATSEYSHQGVQAPGGTGTGTRRCGHHECSNREVWVPGSVGTKRV